MPEYKPRRLGDSFASTTPVRGDAPVVQASDLEPTFDILTLGRYVPYSGSGSTSTFATANLFYFIPLLPLMSNFELHHGRVKVTTSSAGQVGRGAFYSYENGVLTKVTGSEIAIPTDSASSTVTVNTNFTLSKQTQYFWVSGATSTTPSFNVFNMSDSSPRITPYYTLSISSMATGTLPTPIMISNLTKNYVTNAIVGIMPTFFSRTMLNFM